MERNAIAIFFTTSFLLPGLFFPESSPFVTASFVTDNSLDMTHSHKIKLTKKLQQNFNLPLDSSLIGNAFHQVVLPIKEYKKRRYQVNNRNRKSKTYLTGIDL